MHEFTRFCGEGGPFHHVFQMFSFSSLNAQPPGSAVSDNVSRTPKMSPSLCLSWHR